jgi:hypothetical protein
MTKNSAVMMLIIAATLVACQKQQTDQERKAEVDRQVQERLAAEHQQQQAQEIAQREASVAAREQSLKEKQDSEAAAPTQPATEPQAAVETRNAAETGSENSYSTFYTRLEPYGDWIETDDYGYVYHPREAENNRWRPYTDGHWVYTDAGWTWVSEEAFGWATYHYGRWTRLRGVGWVWVPGNEWAPAWVSWRKGGQYVGWAPLPPEAHFDRASGIHNWSDNYYDVGPDQYCFVPTAEIGEQRIARVIVPAQQNVTIVNQTTNVTNITYNKTVVMNQGPSYDELRAQSRTPIQRLRLQRETSVPAGNAHAVVRGEAVVISAPVIAAPQAAERPRAVKQTIKQATVDRGWSAVSNQHDAEQTRAKMKTEATQPPNAPQRKFVKPAVAPAATLPPAASNAPIAEPTRGPQGRAITPARPIPPNATTKPPTPATPSPSRPPTAPEKATAFPAGSPKTATSATPPPRQRNTPPRPPARTLPSASPATSASEENSAEASPAKATPSAPPLGPGPNQQRPGEKMKNLPRHQHPGEPAASPSPSPR